MIGVLSGNISADPWRLSSADLHLPQLCFRSERNGALGFDFQFMLQQFSWGHFLIAMIVLNLVWYCFVVLVFYRAGVLAFLGGRADGAEDGRQGSVHEKGRSLDEGDDRIGREVDEALMGSSRLPDGIEVKSSSQLNFSASDGGGRYDQVGLVADVVQELKEIFSSLDSSGGGKAEFMRKVSELREDYGQIGGHPSIGAINGFIRERALFPISDAELHELLY